MGRKGHIDWIPTATMEYSRLSIHGILQLLYGSIVESNGGRQPEGAPCRDHWQGRGDRPNLGLQTVLDGLGKARVEHVLNAFYVAEGVGSALNKIVHCQDFPAPTVSLAIDTFRSAAQRDTPIDSNKTKAARLRAIFEPILNLA